MYIIFWKPLQDYIIYNYAALYHICKALYLVLVTKTIADTHTGTHGHTWTHADTRPRRLTGGEREREREREALGLHPILNDLKDSKTIKDLMAIHNSL